MILYNHLASTFMLLFCCIIFHSSAISKLNSKLSVVTLNIANYDDHPYWGARVKLIARDLIAANADLIALQEVRLNPDHPSTKKTFQNQAEQILFQLNKKGKYLGAQLVTQPTMYYPFYVPRYEKSFETIMRIVNNNETLPPLWEKGIRVFLQNKDYEGVRDFIRLQYKNHGIMRGDYVLPKRVSNEKKTMIWEGSAIISKRRILESGSIFMTTPSNCHDLNKRATQFVSVSLESRASAQSPDHDVKNPKLFHFFNTHLGLETPCAISEVRETIKYMKRFSGPTLLVGDFNIEPTHEALKHFRKNEFTDLWQHLHKEHDDSVLVSKVSPKDTLLETSSDFEDSPDADAEGTFDADPDAEDMSDAGPEDSSYTDTVKATEKEQLQKMESTLFLETRTKCRYHGWCTFPSHKPIKRIDYAWASRDLVPYVSQMRLLGTKAKKTGKKLVFPSDHFGYVIEFNLDQNNRRQSSSNELSPLLN